MNGITSLPFVLSLSKDLFSALLTIHLKPSQILNPRQIR
jgi:hypothetical protein